MAIQNQNLEIVRGGACLVEFNVIDTNGDAVDLSTATSFTSQVREGPGRKLLASMSYNSSESTLASGIVAFTLSATESLKVTDGAKYDAHYTMGGLKTYFVRGKFIVDKAITE